MPRVLLIDNLDSFTFNLVHAFEVLGGHVEMIRAQTASIHDCLKIHPTHIVLGPGPGAPKDAALSMGLLEACQGKVPILGICLGHQCIGEWYGGTVIRARSGPVHGKASRMSHQGSGLFQGIPNPFSATRYHSLVVESHTLPDCLRVTAVSEIDGALMGLAHKEYPVEGVQFHPESIVSEYGMQLFNNFLTQTKELLC